MVAPSSTCSKQDSSVPHDQQSSSETASEPLLCADSHTDEPSAPRIAWLFSILLGYSRLMWGRFVLHRDLGTMLRCHVATFGAFGPASRKLLYHRMKATSSSSARFIAVLLCATLAFTLRLADIGVFPLMVFYTAISLTVFRGRSDPQRRIIGPLGLVNSRRERASPMPQ
jgi:hypothetical protein